MPSPSATISETRSRQIFIGPAGWSYEDWEGVVYPPKPPRGFLPLGFLARYFNAVEINTTFYHLPPPSHCQKWISAIEPFEGFLFTIKLWQEFTHIRARLDSAALRRWHAAMEPFRRAGRLGAVLVQFPWSFKRTPPNARYLEQLADALAPDPLAIEMRHDTWNHPDYLAWLRERGLAFCNIDQPQLEGCLPPTDHVTAPIAYARLHGRNVGNWFREGAGVIERYNYLYSNEELSDWKERFRRLIEKAEKVFVITNNHTEGRAVANALQIRAMLSDAKVAAPPLLVRRYPQIAEYVSPPPDEAETSPPGEAEQLSLL